MAKNSAGKILAGLILIFLGLAVIGLKFYQISQISVFHLLLGGIFLAGYFHNRAYGFLIPGCLLLSLGLLATPGRYLGFSDFSPIALGVGFIAIYVIDLIYRGKSSWWPLIPGFILIFAGLRQLESLRSLLWPVLLIVLGIYLILNSLNIFKRKSRP